MNDNIVDNIVVEHDTTAWHCFGIEDIYSIIVNECTIER